MYLSLWFGTKRPGVQIPALRPREKQPVFTGCFSFSVCFDTLAFSGRALNAVDAEQDHGAAQQPGKRKRLMQNQGAGEDRNNGCEVCKNRRSGNGKPGQTVVGEEEAED